MLVQGLRTSKREARAQFRAQVRVGEQGQLALQDQPPGGGDAQPPQLQTVPWVLIEAVGHCSTACTRTHRYTFSHNTQRRPRLYSYAHPIHLISRKSCGAG